MTEAEFQVVMQRAGLLAQVADDETDYQGALRALQQADAFGCFTDPTAWRDHLGDREAAQKLLSKLIPFVAAAREFMAMAREKAGAS